MRWSPRKSWCGLAVGLLLPTGCAGTLDLVTSQRFQDRPFQTLFSSEDPMQVLETTEQGDERVRALHAVREPKKHGGTDAEQQRLMAILQASATTDRRALCRLAAIETLGNFEDPQAGTILVAAYHHAKQESPNDGNIISAGSKRPTPSTFPPDIAGNIQARVLDSLGKHRSPEGLKLLCEVAAVPSPEKKPPEEGVTTVAFTADSASDLDRIDLRLAALRSLRNYKGEGAAVPTLIKVLQTDKDVAIRGRTHEAFTKITGEDFPPDGQVWADWWAKNPALRR